MVRFARGNFAVTSCVGAGARIRARYASGGFNGDNRPRSATPGMQEVATMIAGVILTVSFGVFMVPVYQFVQGELD
jgi:hypothetical protein